MLFIIPLFNNKGIFLQNKPSFMNKLNNFLQTRKEIFYK